MEYKKHRNCLLHSCCIFFSVETGAKIIGYLGVVSNSINILVTIAMIVRLAVGPIPTPNMTTTTTESPFTTTEPDFLDDMNFNAMNLVDDIKINTLNSPDSDLNNVVDTIILLIFSLLINMFTLSSNVIMLMGLYKRLAPYVKFGLVVNSVTVAVAFCITLGTVFVYPSVPTFSSLIYFVIPIYLLLVIRSAYYDMIDSEAALPIYTFGTPGKGPYHHF